jgi:hypothetical protein
MQNFQRRPHLAAVTPYAVLPYIVILLSVFSVPAVSQSAEPGIRHRIDATVGIEPTSSLIRPSRELKGILTLFVRISANSRESRYFGVLSPRFSDIVVSEKSPVLLPQTTIWEEDICHQRRGLPKVTVTRVEATFGAAADSLNVTASVRKIGLHVPSDELTPGIKLPEGTDAIGRYYGIRARTRDSRIDVDLKIYEFDCVVRS